MSNFKLSFAAALALCLFGLGVDSANAANWKSIRPSKDRGSECVRTGAQEFDYYLLEEEDPVVVRIRGPQRLKIITRYLFAEADAQGAPYRLVVRLDGREELRRTFRASPLPSVRLCDENGEVASLRRAYINVPTGVHDIQILAESSGEGRVAARIFRESRTRKAKMVSYAAEHFDAVYHLQFESGSQSTYYHFSEDSPLRFTVIGPTTLEIDTRLDFDHTMNGTMAYQLEVVQDGEALPRYFYHTNKLSTATYLERRDILPGARKRMKLTVPKGSHQYEIRCVGPQTCGVAVKIRIPEADLQGK